MKTALYRVQFHSVDGKVDEVDIELRRTYSSGGLRIALKQVASMVKWPRGDNTQAIVIVRME